MFCRICEFGCEGDGPEPPRRPWTGEVTCTEAPTSFLPDPIGAELSSFLEAGVGVPGASPALLAEEALPVGGAEAQGLLGIVPLKVAGLWILGFVGAVFASEGGFFGSFLGKGALLLAGAAEGTTFLGAAGATASFSSTCRSSFVAARRVTGLVGPVIPQLSYRN